MERNFTNENFEGFLRENADGLRMRPSSKIWKNISARLNRRKRRIGFFLGFSLLSITAIGYYLIDFNPENITRPAGEHASNPVNTISENSKHLQQQSNVLLSHPIDKESKKITSGNSFVGSGSTSENGTVSITNSLISNQENNLLAFDQYKPTAVDTYLMNKFQLENKAIDLNKLNALKIPLTNEALVHSLEAKQKKSRLSFQVFLTPTISYRRLSDNKSYYNSSNSVSTPSNFPNLYNINSAVTHKPDFGFELGTTMKYQVSNKLKVRGGLQFNVDRYDIKTFNSALQYATIRLNNFDSVSRITSYNNFNGYKSNWLHNFYFSVSAPIGLEYKIKGDEKMQFGIAGTIQPTYILGDRAYLISSDYKNYIEVPWLIRHWNVSTSFETFVAYSTNHLKWQVGPQVRYQLFSSFVKKYPVKENLFDFGLKVGVSLNKK